MCVLHRIVHLVNFKYWYLENRLLENDLSIMLIFHNLIMKLFYYNKVIFC